jgi:hypothetical protein
VPELALVTVPPVATQAIGGVVTANGLLVAGTREPELAVNV